MMIVDKTMEQKLFKEFFPLSKMIRNMVQGILDEPKYENIAKAICVKATEFCDEFLDPSTFIDDFVVEVEDVLEYECRRCSMTLNTDGRLSNSFIDETPVLGIVANLDNGYIYPFNNPNTIVPKKEYLVTGVGPDGSVTFNGGMYLNRVGDLNSTIRATEHGMCLLIVKRQTYTDIPHGFTNIEAEKKSFLDKINIFNFFRRKRTAQSSSTSINIYYTRWGDVDDPFAGIMTDTVSKSGLMTNPNPASLLIPFANAEIKEPKVSYDIQNFREEWFKMLKTGKGKFSITISGADEEEDNDKNGSIPKDPISE